MMMSMVVGLREPGVHIGWQYIHINGIWQVQVSFFLTEFAKQGNNWG
jgi:hypothetical protein